MQLNNKNREVTIELIHNCIHWSSLYTGLGRDEKGRKFSIIKSSFHADGIRSILNEYEGIRWYCQQRRVNPEDVIYQFVQQKSYARLDMAYHYGEYSKLELPLLKNASKLNSAICHYVEIFGKDGYKVCHGDYTLRNIIFDNKKVSWVVDWENFNNFMPKGFDPIICIMIAVFYWNRINGKLSKRDIAFIRKLFRFLEYELGLSKNIFTQPANWCRETILFNSDLLGVQYKKFPFVRCPLKEIGKIDSYFLQEKY